MQFFKKLKVDSFPVSRTEKIRDHNKVKNVVFVRSRVGSRTTKVAGKKLKLVSFVNATATLNYFDSTFEDNEAGQIDAKTVD